GIFHGQTNKKSFGNCCSLMWAQANGRGCYIPSCSRGCPKGKDPLELLAIQLIECH
ncbi:hypothetical protein KI387_011062, partial [Taxus chinensis]